MRRLARLEGRGSRGERARGAEVAIAAAMLVALALAAPGCTALFSYDCGAACEERAHCGNGVDDDEDHLVDCADDDCSGTPACPEYAYCADGRDNDLDGRIDARDAECWPSALVMTERCASILGGTIELTPDDFSGGALESDPLGLGAGAWRAVPTTLSLTHLDPSVVALRAASGALDGTRAEATLWLEGNPAAAPGVSIRLATVSGARSSRHSIDLGLFSNQALLTGAITPANVVVMTTATQVLPGAHLRVGVTIEIHGRAVHVVVTPEGRAPIEIDAQLADDWVEGPSLSIGFASAVLGGVWLEHATIARTRLVRCGTPLPPLGVVERDGVSRMETGLHAVTRGPGTNLCAVAGFRVAENGEIAAIHSEDDGATWSRTATLSLGSPFTAATGWWHALAWDPILERYFAASIVNGALRVQSSPDCVSWDPPATALMNVSDLHPLYDRAAPAYRIDASGHELRVPVPVDDTTFALLPLRSPWGDPGTWTAGELTTDLPPIPSWRATLPFAARIEEHGAPVLLWDGGRSIEVHVNGAWTELASLHASESDEAGAYDAIAVTGAAALVEDLEPPLPGVWSGRLFGSGASDLAPDEGWGWTRVCMWVVGDGASSAQAREACEQRTSP